MSQKVSEALRILITAVLTALLTFATSLLQSCSSTGHVEWDTKTQRLESDSVVSDKDLKLTIGDWRQYLTFYSD